MSFARRTFATSIVFTLLGAAVACSGGAPDEELQPKPKTSTKRDSGIPLAETPQTPVVTTVTTVPDAGTATVAVVVVDAGLPVPDAQAAVVAPKPPAVNPFCANLASCCAKLDVFNGAVCSYLAMSNDSFQCGGGLIGYGCAQR